MLLFYMLFVNSQNTLTSTDHSTVEVVPYKVFPRDFPVLSLVESQQTYHRHTSQHHEKQPVVRIVWIAN